MKAVISILILAIVAGACTQIPAVRPVDNVFFEIGQEDQSELELNWRTSGEIEYSCTVGVDCSTEAFPSAQSKGGARGEERIIITFRLDRAYDNVILRLVRSGDPTTAVTIDGKQTYRVTREMLGSGPHVYGAYNLMLGTLNKGVHAIQLDIVGALFQWDAISLIQG